MANAETPKSKVETSGQAATVAVEETTLARQLTGGLRKLLDLTAVVWAVFVMANSLFMFVPDMIHRAIFLGFALAIGFTLFRPTVRSGVTRVGGLDLALIAVSLAAVVHFILQYERLVHTAFMVRPSDLLLGLALIALVLEIGRRTIGWSFVGLALVLILYAYFGRYMPGVWAHRGLSLEALVEALYMSTTGLWGMIPGIASTTVAVFIIFGSMLFHTRAGNTFTDLAMIVSGRAAGGAAKVSVLSSALFGMINGSGAANASTTGSVTIPAMIRLGYSRVFAAAVETVGSTGGQIMPPIMGVGAFIMAELVGVSYFKIAAMAIIPAILYYLCAYMSIHFEAVTVGYRGLTPHEIPSLKAALYWRRSIPLALPLGTLIYFMLAGYTPTFAGILGIAVGAVCHLFLAGPMTEWRSRALDLWRGLKAGGYGMLSLAILASGAQIIVSMIGMTGVAITISDALIRVSGGNLLAALAVTALITTVLGMGVTTVADYVITAAIAAPVLVKLGVPLVYAHLFIFYFSASSGMTPPVGATAFVTAGIAGSNFFKTCAHSCRIALSAFVVPFILIYRPGIALQGDVWDILYASVMAGAGLVAISGAISGFLFRRTTGPERALLALSGAALLIPTFWADATGVALLVMVVLLQKLGRQPVSAKAEAAG